jgi:succinate dehydrogenase/fumarate reductase flavoprotein subunit
MVFELLGDANGVSGALGVDARADKVIEFQAKSVVLSTGLCMRLYQPITPGWIGNTDFPFNLSGDGRAMAYRLGAELTNVEWPYRHSGIAYFQRNGRGSWLGVLRDYQGKSIGPFIDKPSLQYGDSAMTAVEILDKHLKTGKGTIYIDHRGMSDKELEYMAFWLTHEQQIATLNHLQEEGIDLGKHQIGFMSYGIRFKGGVSINTEAETSVRGLYAAGDEFTISIGPAATYGRIAGENAAKYAKAIPAPDIERSLGKIEEIKSLIERIRSRQWGPDWLEANVAIQQTMNDFAGLIRSESGLDAGLSYLRRVKEKVHKGIMARNQWELIRCLEVINLLDQGELVFITAKARQETRYKHVRSDYPMTHPNMEKLITVKKINEKPVLNWVELRK